MMWFPLLLLLVFDIIGIGAPASGVRLTFKSCLTLRGMVVLKIILLGDQLARARQRLWSGSTSVADTRDCKA